MNTIDPLPFTLTDGREAKFFLRWRHIKQATTEARAASSDPATMGTEFVERVLFYSMVDRNGMSLDEFLDLLPPDIEVVAGFHQTLRQHCCPPADEKYRPTTGQS